MHPTDHMSLLSSQLQHYRVTSGPQYYHVFIVTLHSSSSSDKL